MGLHPNYGPVLWDWKTGSGPWPALESNSWLCPRCEADFYPSPPHQLTDPHQPTETHGGGRGIPMPLPTQDEWQDQFGLGGFAPHLTPEERREGERLLHEVPDLIGSVPAPLADLLQALLEGESTAAAEVLRWLRTVDQT